MSTPFCPEIVNNLLTIHFFHGVKKQQKQKLPPER